MSEHEPEISILDQRLAEIDRRLSRIQVGLADEVGADEAGSPSAGSPVGFDLRPAGARSVALAPAPAPERDDDLDDVDDPGLVAAELRGLISDQARLLDRLAELVAAGERLFAGSAAPPPTPSTSSTSTSPTGRPTPSAATAAGALTVAAGPFASLDAVRAFVRTLGALPGVAGAEVRGYESGDRAVVDVHLARATA